MGFVNHSSARKPIRLTTPLIKNNGRLLPASWEAALTLAGAGLRQIKEQDGPGSLAVLVSSQHTNEESYLLQKLARLALGTNSVTCLSAPPINSSFRNGLGKDASTCTYGDLLASDLIIVYDCELSEKYPVTEIKVREAVGRGSKLIVFNQRQTGLETLANLNFKINQRTGVALLQAMLGYILSYQIFDAKFIDRYTAGFTEFAEAYQDRPLEKLINIPWISPTKLIEATQLYLRARKPVVIIDADSLTPSESTLITDLVLITGNVGRDNGGIILQRSGGNAQGLLNMGISPNYLPGQEPLESAEVRQRLEEKWHAVIPTNKGKDGVSLIKSIESGEIRGLLVAGRESLGVMGNALLEVPIFSVSIDTVVPAKPPFADVVFPGADFIETDGTYTNSENRILQIRKVLLPPAGKQNWEIISLLSKRLGYSMPYGSISEISSEISEIVKDNRPFFDLLSTFNRTNGHNRYQFTLPSVEAALPNVSLGI
jgi:predicted molibdopterin-dependent oxidoreductase YjgC